MNDIYFLILMISIKIVTHNTTLSLLPIFLLRQFEKHSDMSVI